MCSIDSILTQFEEKDVSALLIVTSMMSAASVVISIATFIVTIVNLKGSHPQVESVEVQNSEAAEVQHTEEAEAEETQETQDSQPQVEAQEQEVPPMVRVIRLYRAAEDADQIITRDHTRKRKGLQQITSIVRFLQENGPSTKEAICNAMKALGVTYSGGSSQKVGFTVKCWLNQADLNKGCIISN